MKSEPLCAGNCPAKSVEKYLYPSVGCSFFPGHGPIVVVSDDPLLPSLGPDVEVWKHGNHHELTWWNDPEPKRP